MFYRILGGIAFLLIGLNYLGFGPVPTEVIGAFAVAAGIALLAGV